MHHLLSCLIVETDRVHAKTHVVLTGASKQFRHQELDADIKALALNDVRRAAWFNIDRLGTVWVRACPSEKMRCDETEFAKILYLYFDLFNVICLLSRSEHSGHTLLTGSICA